MLALTGPAGDALGQIAPGRSGVSTEANLENVQAFREVSNFGRCYVLSRRNNALSLLATEPGSPEEAEFVRTRITGEQNCLHGGTRMTMSRVYIRGAIAEGLLRSGAGVPAGFLLPAPTVAEVRSLGDVARCHASGHRADVRALLATNLGSAEELAAVSALWNDFRACMPPGMRIRLNATWIRFLLAEALLRLAETAPAPSQG